MELILGIVVLLTLYCAWQDRAKKKPFTVLSHRGRRYYVCARHTTVMHDTPKCVLCEHGVPVRYHSPNRG